VGTKKPFCTAAEGQYFAGVFLGQSSSFSTLSLPPNAHCIGLSGGETMARSALMLQQDLERDPAGDKRNSKLPKRRRKFEILSSARFARKISAFNCFSTLELAPE
jgi:hypothetical protein